MSARMFLADEPKLVVLGGAEACLLPTMGAVVGPLLLSGGDPTEGGI